MKLPAPLALPRPSLRLPGRRWLVALGLIAAALVALAACTRVSPDAGVEAVLVKKPAFFGHGGVDPQPITTGSTYVALTTEAVMVDMKPQQFGVQFNDLMSRDGIPLHFDAVIRLQVTDAVDLVRRFGPQWYENNVQSEFANRVRQAVRRHGMNETAIDTSAIEGIDAEVTGQMQAYIAQARLPVRLVKVTVGKASPPDAIKNQRIQTAAEQQRQITEVQTKLAEDARREAERSRALADNAYRETLNLSPHEFVELQRIAMQREVCGGDKGPGCTFIVGAATPVINTGAGTTGGR